LDKVVVIFFLTLLDYFSIGCW